MSRSSWAADFSMRVRRLRAVFLVSLVAVMAPPAIAAGDPFLEAQDAFRVGNAARLDAAARRLKGHPLLPYVEYYRWRIDLEQSDDADVEALIEKNAGNYLAEAVRIDWLKHLGRKAQWDRFNQGWTTVATPDAELRCLALEARRQRPDPLLADDTRVLWRSVTDLPEACQDFFNTAFQVSLLGDEDIWDRARRQFDAGRYAHAHKALTYLPAERKVDPRQWSSLNNKTPQFLDGILANALLGPRNRELVGLAVLRLARQSPPEAADYLMRIGQRLPAEQRATLWATIATQAAQQHQPEALAWFARAGSSASLGDEQYRWRVRAALRAGDWARVRQSIETMPPGLAVEPAWIYWLGRAHRAEGQPQLAQLLWTQIADRSDFYGLLAAEELDRRFLLPPKAVPPTVAEMLQVADSGAVKRALAFFKLDLRNEGIREWSWALRGMSDRQLLAAAEYAKRQHIYDRAINAAEKTQTEHDYSLRYLTPYDEKIRPAAKAQSLDDAWVYGLMRQESRFITAAKSSVGAQGLMQVMPATARWVAKKAGLRDYHPSRIADLDTNVMLGTTYLRMVYESLDKHPVLASAAYNAGPGRARRWRDPVRTLEGAIYTESIPFTETRDYVKKVLANAVIYTSLLSGKPDSLKARLGVIKSAASAAPPAEDLP